MWLIYLAYALPLFGPAIRDLHVQAAVPVFFLLFLVLVPDFSRRMRLQSLGPHGGVDVPE